MSRIYLFPGQGSQKKGMGADVFARFREETATASEILGYPVAEQCIDDPGEKARVVVDGIKDRVQRSDNTRSGG